MWLTKKLDHEDSIASETGLWRIWVTQKEDRDEWYTDLKNGSWKTRSTLKLGPEDSLSVIAGLDSGSTWPEISLVIHWFLVIHVLIIICCFYLWIWSVYNSTINTYFFAFIINRWLWTSNYFPQCWNNLFNRCEYPMALSVCNVWPWLSLVCEHTTSFSAGNSREQLGDRR